MTNTQTNLNAARVVGHDPIESVYRKGVVLVGKGQSEREFDIFANTPQGAYDLLQVVNALGEKHRITIEPYWVENINGNDVCAGWMIRSGGIVVGDTHKTYTQAAAAAVNAVMGGE